MADGGISQNEANMLHSRLFSASIDWENYELDLQYVEAQQEIVDNMRPILDDVGAEMIVDLQKHINKDVYKAYRPKAYIRRKDHPEYGTPLDDNTNFDTKTDITGNEATLTFSYYPTGYHTAKFKDLPNDYRNFMSDEPIKPNPVHGDVLINRIQKGEGYDWKVPDIKPRQFWDNFTRDEFNGGIVRYFNKFAAETKLTKYDYKLKKISNKDIQRYGRDGDLDTTATTNDVEDDLPF